MCIEVAVGVQLGGQDVGESSFIEYGEQGLRRHGVEEKDESAGDGRSTVDDYHDEGEIASRRSDIQEVKSCCRHTKPYS